MTATPPPPPEFLSTLETDAEILPVRVFKRTGNKFLGTEQIHGDGQIVPADVARRLERERNGVIEQLCKSVCDTLVALKQRDAARKELAKEQTALITLRINKAANDKLANKLCGLVGKLVEIDWWHGVEGPTFRLNVVDIEHALIHITREEYDTHGNRHVSNSSWTEFNEITDIRPAVI